ncbi:MAG: 3-deoxy-manno-octulosonate cytidylyltransferase [Planctomycetota bacterium]
MDESHASSRSGPRIVAVIPARMGSSRFPGKPLAPLLGRPMIQHVYERAASCGVLDEVVLATCDDEIARAAASFGAPVVMTSSSHERASDRTAEAAESLTAEIVVMIQGDEPMIRPDLIEAAVRPMLDSAEIGCVNLLAEISDEAEFCDPNTIKVVCDARGDAMMMSREPIPTARGLGFGSIPAFKQVCVIPFRDDALRLFASLGPTPLERAESIDMLRFIEHGHRVRMVPVESGMHAVDTPEDLRLVERLLAAQAAA